MAKPKWYVVWKGRKPGIYTTWEECNTQVKGFPGAQFKGFDSRREAERALTASAGDYFWTPPAHVAKESPGDGERDQTTKAAPASEPSVASGPPPVVPSLCVDGACAINPGPMEYQCVRFPTGERVFHAGPFPNGTNNIGEFLAIVQALQYCHAHNLSLPIYSDSRIAIGWVKAKKCKTQLAPGPANVRLFTLIDEAEEWLAGRKYANRVLKWETERWGENPADFGRK
ncbi:MAG: ribonuclease H family protein [Anaerolineae bacterium]